MKYYLIGIIISTIHIINAQVIPIENMDTFKRISPQSVIMITTPTCGPCQLVKPEYRALSNTFNRVTFYMLDLDPNKTTIYSQIAPIASSFNIRGYPTFLFLDNGKEVARLISGEQNFTTKFTTELNNAFTLASSSTKIEPSPKSTKAKREIRPSSRRRKRKNKPCESICSYD